MVVSATTKVYCAGFKYDLPNFILSEPSNLVKSKAEETTPVEYETPSNPPQIA